MTPVNYHYLVEVDAASNTDKFWCIVEIDANNWLRGYGRRGNAGGVRWVKVDRKKALSTKSEKDAKRYKPTSINDLHQATFDDLAAAFQQSNPAEKLVRNSGATSDLFRTSASVTKNNPAQTKPSASQRPAPRSNTRILKNWF